MDYLLIIFVCLKLLRSGVETLLSIQNRRYYLNTNHQKQACELLGIDADDFQKTLAYSDDRFKFGMLSSWVQMALVLAFIIGGGFGYLQAQAVEWAKIFAGGDIITGLIFFGLLGVLSFVLSLPFDLYHTFHIEEKHGFNRQTVGGFVADSLKSIVIGALLGGILLAAILSIMANLGHYWWVWAWLATSLFSLVAAWAYPTFLAPLFNKFHPLEEGELKSGIEKLAAKIGFRSSGISIMDASKRSSHGNAYFTGLFGEKRIVLFDTLLNSLSNQQIIAVLAHELGHFKLNHVRWALWRGVIMTGVIFYILSLCLPMAEFYQAFAFDGIDNYAALVVFSLWFGTIDFYLSPLGSYLSRRNEFAADAFAEKHLGHAQDLCQALLKLRESNRSMPLSHPMYSAVYHSHPPMIERLSAMNYKHD